MGLTIAASHAWWRKNISKNTVVTTQRHSVRLLKPQHFVLSSTSQSATPGRYNSLMSTMLSPRDSHGRSVYGSTTWLRWRRQTWLCLQTSQGCQWSQTSTRAWCKELISFLLNLGFVNSLADTSLFIHRQGSQVIYLLIYVDDILITSNTKSGIARVLVLLAQRFSVKDAEDLNYFLGIEAHRTQQGLHLSQRKYILDLLHKYDMTNAKPVTTPMASSPKLHLHDGVRLSDPTKYRRLIGNLQYLQFTRLDIAYAVNKLSQFMHMPTEYHWQAAKRILRYLAGTPTHGIFYSATNKLTLHAYSDADWAGDSDDYISTNAYIVYLGKHTISWTSKKQN